MSRLANRRIIDAHPLLVERRQLAERRVIASERGTEARDQTAPLLPLVGTRVLFIVPQPFYEDRGSPIAVLQVVRAMSELGIHVDIMAFASGESVDVENLRIFHCGKALRIKHVPIGFSFRKIFLDFALILAVRSRLKAERYTCIHALEDGIYVALAARVAGRIPIIYDMHSCIPEQLATHPMFGNRFAQWILKKLERYALRQSTIVSCSVGLKSYIKSSVPDVPVTEWKFSDPTDDTKAQKLDEAASVLRAELGIDPNARVILYAGNFKDYQGVDILIDAFPIVRQAHPDAILVLLGASNGDNVELLQSGGNGALIVCPRQPHDVVENYLHMAQILVSPRKCGENLPLKLFEYLAAGKPIVATDNRNHRMLLGEDRAVLATSTPAGLAAAIGRLLDDPGKMERLAAAAKIFSEQEFGWINFVASVSEIYQEARRRPTE